MAHYRGTAEGQDRAVALAGVLLVHAALAAAILSGLNVHSVARTIEHLRTFDISEPPPPIPPPPPPPAQRVERAKREAGAPAKKAEASPVVAPRPRVVVPAKPPIVAAPIAGTGSAPSSGAAAAGIGTGAGGSGNGPGGGGSGLASNPRLIAGGPTKADYRRLGARISGPTQAVIRLSLNSDGRVVDCSVVGSSGYPNVDAGICPLLKPRMQWSPARDRNGRPTPSWFNFVVTLTRH